MPVETSEYGKCHEQPIKPLQGLGRVDGKRR